MLHWIEIIWRSCGSWFVVKQYPRLLLIEVVLWIVCNKFHYHFRQEPLKDIPMLLVQGVDVYGIYKQGNCWKNINAEMGCEVAIAYTPGTRKSNEKDP